MAPAGPKTSRIENSCIGSLALVEDHRYPHVVVGDDEEPVIPDL